MQKPDAASTQNKPADASVEVTKFKVAKVQLEKFRSAAWSVTRTAL